MVKKLVESFSLRGGGAQVVHTAHRTMLRTAATVAAAALLRTVAGQIQCDYLGSDLEATSATVGWDR